MLETFPPADRAATLQPLPPATIARVVVAMVGAAVAETIAALPARTVAALVAELELDAGARLLRRVPAADRVELLPLLPDDRAAAYERLLAYPEGTVASFMDPLVFTLPDDVGVDEAIERLRRSARTALYYVYVVDRADRLAGVINMRELMLADPDARIGTVMRTDVARLVAGDRASAIVAHPAWGEVHALPVVDEAGRFVGALRYETLRRLEERRETPTGAARAAASLAELYGIGIGALMQGARELGGREAAS